MEMAAPEPASAGLADVLREHNNASTVGGGKVVFGSQLRIQVPSGRAVELVSSPIEFGVKNWDAQLAVLSPARRFLPKVVSSPTARVFAAGVAPGEMAMSEDYTCVISRGPNPRTRHIFDDCIVESCGDVLVDGGAGAAVDGDAVPASGFLSYCHACHKQLGHASVWFFTCEKSFDLVHGINSSRLMRGPRNNCSIFLVPTNSCANRGSVEVLLDVELFH